MIPLPNQISTFVNNQLRIIQPWIGYLQQFTQAPPSIVDIDVDSSPFLYEAKEPGYIHVTGGIVSSIILTRGIVSLSFTGVVIIPVSIADTITITYTVLPTVKFVPSYGQNTGS